MPTDVKLNAEGVEAARAVLVEGRDNFATFEQHAAGIVRAYLAAAHSQHEADVARIGELTEALRPFAERVDAWATVGGPYEMEEYPPRLFAAMKRARSVLAGEIDQTKSALDGVKP